MPSKTELSLPIRVTPRKPTDKAVAKLQSIKPLPSGRPIPNAAELAGLISTINTHLHHQSARADISRDINLCKNYLAGPILFADDWRTPEHLVELTQKLETIPISLPFPDESWEDIFHQPNEAVLIDFLTENTSYWASHLHIAHLLENGLPSATFRARPAFHQTHQATLAKYWNILVEKAYADAQADQLEFTPLLDLLWQTIEDNRYKVAEPYPLPPDFKFPNLPLSHSRPGALPCPKTEALLSTQADSNLTRRALQFKSSAWRRRVIAKSAAMSDPMLVLDCLDMLNENNMNLLLANPALSPATVEVLHEWLIFQMTQPEVIFSERFQTLLEGLTTLGYPLTATHERRMLALICFQKSSPLRLQLAEIPQVAKIPLIFDELLKTRDPQIWSSLAEVATGPTWLSLVNKVGAAMPVSTSTAFIDLLEAARPEQVVGLTRRSLESWMSHADKRVRLATIKLMAYLPDGQAPALPPLPSKRRSL